MSYQINLGQWNTVFAVPASVTDQHLKLASEAQLKTLLYLLRHAGESVTDDQIVKATGCSAVAFWIDRGLLTQGADLLLPAAGTADHQSATTAVSDNQSGLRHTAVSRAVRPDTAFVTKLLNEDQNLEGLLDEAQSVLNKPLSPGDTATLVMLYHSFGLPCDVLAMLLHYAASAGIANMRAIERIGIEWSDNGIDSVEAAEREIERMSHCREAWGRVSSLIGLRNAGKPTKAQLANADRWLNRWGFHDEMILEAYERCVNTKGEYNMSYINAILKRWFEKRIFSLDALKESESAKTASAQTRRKAGSKGTVFSTEGASFDLERYEKQSLFDD